MKFVISVLVIEIYLYLSKKKKHLLSKTTRFIRILFIILIDGICAFNFLLQRSCRNTVSDMIRTFV